MRVLIVSLLILVIDQITKFWIKANFRLYESKEIMGDFFRFTYIENPGMAFGIRFAGPWFFTLFSAIASVAIIIILYRMRQEKLFPRLALAFVLGGAMGNLIDRFLYSQVVDFFDFGVTGVYRFAIFNIADSAVTIGMVMLIMQILFEKDDSKDDKSRLPESSKKLPDSEERDIWQIGK